MKLLFMNLMIIINLPINYYYCLLAFIIITIFDNKIHFNNKHFNNKHFNNKLFYKIKNYINGK